MGTHSSQKAGAGCVLVVDDELGLVRHIERTLQSVLRVRTATTVREAIDVIVQEDQLSGAVIDIGLPDGSGVAIAELVRERYDYVPMMILTGNHEPSVINRAHALGASYVAKPDYDDSLSRFLREVLIDPEHNRRRLSAAVEAYVAQHGLSSRESQILGLAIGGVPRARISEVLGVSENTIKTQVRSLLDKCNESNLADAVWRVRKSSERGRAPVSLGTPR